MTETSSGRAGGGIGVRPRNWQLRSGESELEGEALEEARGEVKGLGPGFLGMDSTSIARLPSWVGSAPREGRVHGLDSMSLEWERGIVHTAHPVELGQWWADALSWAVVWQSEDE